MARRRGASSIDVDGLQELSRALKKLEDRELEKKLRGAHKDVADIVATSSKALAYSLGGVAAHVAPSIKAAAGAQFAAVSGGGPAQPAFAGAEFGSDKYKQFKPWRGAGQNAGYFVWPSIRHDHDQVDHVYTQTIDDLLQEAGLA